MTAAPRLLVVLAAVSMIAAPGMAADRTLDSVFSDGATAKPASDGGFVIEDRSGHRKGRMKPADNGYIVEDEQGRRIGSITYDPTYDQWKIEGP